MTEQDYCDASDLAIFRAVLLQLSMANAFEQPNSQRLKGIQENLKLMIAHLEKEISEKIA